MTRVTALRAGARRWASDRGAVLVAICLVLLLVVPNIVRDAFLTHVAVTICVFAALSTAWNIAGGFAGQLSFGHAIFYGLGGYTGVMLVSVGVSPWIGMVAGAALSAAVGAAIGYPCLRLKGPFFSLASVAFLEVIRLSALQFRDITGGATGLMVPLNIGWQWMVFRDPEPALVIAFGLLLATLAVAGWIRGHRVGYYLVATRERETAAMAVGVDTVRVRLFAVMASAALTSCVGTFHSMYLTFIDPNSLFSLTLSVQIAMFALIGGLGTVIGPLLGTLLVVPVTEVARGWLGAQAVGLHGLVYGLVLVLMVLFLPQGLVGLLPARGREDVRPEPATPPASTPPPCPAVPENHARPAGPLLSATGLRKSFGGLAVTSGISVSLDAGEILGIIGPNGAGKTTLFNLLSGFLKPDAGSVTVHDADGRAVHPVTAHDFARAGVGRTFQVVQPFSSMTVLENIMVGAFAKYPSVADARDKANQIAEQMGLWRSRDQEARILPIGGQKRLEVARVMATEPRILLLDEVMAGLNQTDVAQAVRLIRTIRDTGVSIVAIEHVMQAIMALSDRIVVINSGHVIASGQPADVVRDPAVIAAYLGVDYAHAAAG